MKNKLLIEVQPKRAFAKIVEMNLSFIKAQAVFTVATNARWKVSTKNG